MTETNERWPIEGASGTYSDRGWKPPASGLTSQQAGLIVQTLDDDATDHEEGANTALWRLADVLVWCEDHLGDKFSQITPDPTRNRRSYTMLMRIARAFEDHERRWASAKVSVWAHGEVYGLPDYMADELLEDYAERTLTRDQLREEAQRLRELQEKQAQGQLPGTEDDSEPSEAEPLVCPLCLGAGHVPDEEREAYLASLAGHR